MVTAVSRRALGLAAALVAITAGALLLPSCGSSGPGTRAAERPQVPPLVLSEDLAAARAASTADGLPVLILVREDGDSTSIDGEHWLAEDESVRPALAGAHLVAAWRTDPEIKKLSLRGGILVVQRPGQPAIAAAEIPARRSQLAATIATLLAPATPATTDAPPADGSAKPKDSAKDSPKDGIARRLADLTVLFKGSEQDPTTFGKARPVLAELIAMPMPPERLQECAGTLAAVAIEMDDATARTALLERLASEAPRGRFTADACLDLADDAYADGHEDAAARCWELAERAAGDGESPTLASAARAARALAIAPSTPARAAWERRTVLDVVVLVPDQATFIAAIGHWSDRAFFPVLFQDDIYAPKFISAFAPARVVTLPSVLSNAPARQPGAAASEGDPVDIGRLRAAILDSWSDAKARRGTPTASDEQLRARLGKLGLAPDGIVLADPASGELAGGLALAAGRFQGFEIMASPETGVDHHHATPADQISSEQAWTMASGVEAALARWPKPDDGAWRFVTLAGAYPFRRQGADNWGNTYSLDDLLGRSADGVRHAVVGRLLGDAARGAYQAACSLFLQPDAALLFDTYDRNPRTTFGHYRLDPITASWPPRLRCDHVCGAAADIAGFRAHCSPWNRNPALIITSSGGPDSWSVPGGGGTTEDFPVGVPTCMHVTHSGSAMNPYDIDTLAGRAVAGGAFFYFGSVNEPFLNAFQSARYAARRIAGGAPLAAVYRTRSGQWGAGPWRLMAIGDPQFCLRRTPLTRGSSTAANSSLVPEGASEVTLGAPGGPSLAERLRRARWLGDHAAAQAAVATIDDPSTLEGNALVMAMEECLESDACPRALELWDRSHATARIEPWARIYSVLAIGRLLDQASSADDLERMLARLSSLLSAKPAVNVVERWMDVADALARRRASADRFERWLVERRDDPLSAGFARQIRARLAGIAARRLAAQESWADADKAAALVTIAELGKAGIPADQLSSRIDELMLACVGKLPGATVDSFLAEVAAMAPSAPSALEAPADDGSGKRIADALALIQARRLLFKDWMILGPFANAAHGSWEALEATAGAVDVAATWAEGAENLRWQRPFPAEAFGVVDLAAVLTPNTDVHAYALAELVAEHDIQGFLLLGSDDGVTAWLDGKQIWRNPSFRGVTVDQDKVPLAVGAGTHSLLLRVDQGGGGWGFCARLAADQEGKQQLAGALLRAVAAPAPAIPPAPPAPPALPDPQVTEPAAKPDVPQVDAPAPVP